MGTTVGVVLLSYDVNRLHVQVKDALINMGYSINWKYGDGPTYYMPNTTVWHNSKSTNQAISDLRNICLSLSVNLERAVAVLADEFAGI